jgi:hypothetical protein
MDPATVWMVHKDTPKNGVRGRLSLEPAHLVFRPDVAAGAAVDSLGQTVLGVDEIGKVARARASPVLEVHTSTPGLPGVVLFYFAKPPDIYTSASVNPRARGATYLGTSNTFLSDVVGEWVSAVRAAVRG